MTQPDPLIGMAETLVALAPERLSMLGAGIMAAVDLGIAHDSRAFARNLDLAHALVIRECVTLAEEPGLIDIENRNDRTQRLHYGLTELGQALVRESARQ